MSSIATDLRARAIHYVSEMATNHVLSRSNGYESHNQKPPPPIRAQLLEISTLPRFSSYLFLDGSDPFTFRKKAASLRMLYVPVVNRPYSVIGPSNAFTDRMQISDASLFNESVRVQNTFGPRARGWKCANNAASDVTICVCPALTLRRYLKQKEGQYKSTIEYLKATSSDSLLCFNTTTMEMTYFFPLASYDQIGPCSNISALPVEICASYLGSFMGLDASRTDTANLNESLKSLPPGTAAALLTCCDGRIYLVIAITYKIKHIQLFTVLQPVPNLFASSITSMSVTLLSASNANSDAPRLLLLASGPLALATPQPAIVHLFSGVKTSSIPPPVICAYVAHFTKDSGAIPHVTVSLSLVASSFNDLLQIAVGSSPTSHVHVPSAIRVVSNGKGPDIVLAGHYRTFLKPLYLRRNGPKTTNIAQSIEKSSMGDTSGVRISAGTDTPSAAQGTATGLIPHRQEISKAFSRTLWYFCRSFGGSVGGSTTSFLLSPRTILIFLRLLLTDWLLFTIYLIGLCTYAFQGAFAALSSKLGRTTPKTSKRETHGAYAIPDRVYPLLFNHPAKAYNFLLSLSDESIIGAKTVQYHCDGAPTGKESAVQTLNLYLISRDALQLPRNSHVADLSTRPILLYKEYDVQLYQQDLLESVQIEDLTASLTQNGKGCANIDGLSGNIPSIPDNISRRIAEALRASSDTSALHSSLSRLDHRKSQTLLDSATEQLKVLTSSSYLYFSADKCSLSRASSQAFSLHNSSMDTGGGATDTFTHVTPLLSVVLFSYTAHTFYLNIYSLADSISCCYSLPVSLNAVEEALDDLDGVHLFLSKIDYSTLYQGGRSMERASQLLALDSKRVLTSGVTFQDSCTGDTGDSDSDHFNGTKPDATVLERREEGQSRLSSAGRHRRKKSTSIERQPVICAGIQLCIRRENVVYGAGCYIVNFCDVINDCSAKKHLNQTTPVPGTPSTPRLKNKAQRYKVIQLPVVREAVTMSFAFVGVVSKTKTVSLPMNANLYGCTTVEVLFNTRQRSRISEILNLAIGEKTAFEYKSGTAYPSPELLKLQGKSEDNALAPGSSVKMALELLNKYIRNNKVLVQTRDEMLGKRTHQASTSKLKVASNELALLSLLYTMAIKDADIVSDAVVGTGDTSTPDDSSSLNWRILEIMTTWFEKGPATAFNILQRTSLLDLLANYKQFQALLYTMMRRVARTVCDTLVFNQQRTVTLHDFMSLIELMSAQVGLTKLLEQCYTKSVTSVLEMLSMSLTLSEEFIYELSEIIKSQNSFTSYYNPYRSAESTPFFVSYSALLRYVLDLTGRDYTLPESYEDATLCKGTPEYLQYFNCTALFLAANNVCSVMGQDVPVLPGFLIFYLHLYLCPQQHGNPHNIVGSFQQRLKNGVLKVIPEVTQTVIHAILYKTVELYVDTMYSGKHLFKSFDSLPDQLISGAAGPTVLLLRLWPLSQYTGCKARSSSELMRHLLTLNSTVTVLTTVKKMSDAHKDTHGRSRKDAAQTETQVQTQDQLRKKFEDSIAQGSPLICRELGDSLMCAAFSSPAYTQLLQHLNDKLQTLAQRVSSLEDDSPDLKFGDTECDKTYEQAMTQTHRLPNLILTSPNLSAIFDRGTASLEKDSVSVQQALIDQLQYAGKYIGFFTTLYYFVGYSFKLTEFAPDETSIAYTSTPIHGQCTPIITTTKTIILEDDSQGQIQRAIKLSDTIIKRLVPHVEQAIRDTNEYTRMFITELITMRTKDGCVDGIATLMRAVLNIGDVALSNLRDESLVEAAHMHARFKMYEYIKRGLIEQLIPAHVLYCMLSELKKVDAHTVLATPALFSWKEFCLLPPWVAILTFLASATLSPAILEGEQSLVWVGHYYNSYFAAYLPEVLKDGAEVGQDKVASLLQGHVSPDILMDSNVADVIDALLLLVTDTTQCDDIFREKVLRESLHGVLHLPYAVQAIIAQYLYIKTVIASQPPTRAVLNTVVSVLSEPAGSTPFVANTSDQNGYASSLPSVPPLYPFYTYCGLSSTFSSSSFKPLIAFLYMIALSERDIARLTPQERQDLYKHIVALILAPEIREASKMAEKIESVSLLQDISMTGILISPLSRLQLSFDQSIDRYIDTYRKMCASFVRAHANAPHTPELEEEIRKLIHITTGDEMFAGVDGPGIIIEYALQYRAKHILMLLATTFDMFVLVLEASCNYVQEIYDSRSKACDADKSDSTDSSFYITTQGSIDIILESYASVNDTAAFLYNLFDDISLDPATHPSATIRKCTLATVLRGLSAQVLFFIKKRFTHAHTSLLLTTIRGSGASFSDMSPDIASSVAPDSGDLAAALMGDNRGNPSFIVDWIDLYKMSFNYYWKLLNNMPVTNYDPYYPSSVARILASSLSLLPIKAESAPGKKSATAYHSFLLYLLLITSFFYIPLPESLRAAHTSTIAVGGTSLYEQILHCATVDPLPHDMDAIVPSEKPTIGSITTKVIAGLMGESGSKSLSDTLSDFTTSGRDSNNVYLSRNDFVRSLIGQTTVSPSDYASTCTLSTIITCCYVVMLIEYVYDKKPISAEDSVTPNMYIYKGLLSLVSSPPVSNLCSAKDKLHFMNIPIPLLAKLRMPFLDKVMMRLSRESWASEPSAVFLYLSLTNSKKLSPGLFLATSSDYVYNTPNIMLLSLAAGLLDIPVLRTDISAANKQMQKHGKEDINRYILQAFSALRTRKRPYASYLSLDDLQEDTYSKYFHGMPYTRLLIPSQILDSDLRTLVARAIESGISIFPDSFGTGETYRQTINRMKSISETTGYALFTAFQELAAFTDAYDSRDESGAFADLVCSLTKAIFSSVLMIYHNLMAFGPFYTIVALILHIFTEDRKPSEQIATVCAELRNFASDYLKLAYMCSQYCKTSGEALSVSLPLLGDFIEELVFSAHAGMADKLVDIFASYIVNGDPGKCSYAQEIYRLYTVVAGAKAQGAGDFLMKVLGRLPPCRKRWFVPWFTHKAVTAALNLPHDQIRETVNLAYINKLLKDEDTSESSSLLEYLDLSFTVNTSHMLSNIIEQSPIVTGASNIMPAIQAFITAGKSSTAKQFDLIATAYRNLLQIISFDIKIVDNYVELAHLLQKLKNSLLETLPEQLRVTMDAVLVGETIHFLALHPSLREIAAGSISNLCSIWSHGSNRNSDQRSTAARQSDADVSIRASINASAKASVAEPEPAKEVVQSGWEVNDTSSLDEDVHPDSCKLPPVPPQTASTAPQPPPQEITAKETRGGEQQQNAWECDDTSTNGEDDPAPAPASTGNCWNAESSDTNHEAWSSAEEEEIPSVHSSISLASRVAYNVRSDSASSMSQQGLKQRYFPLEVLDICANMIEQALHARKTANCYVEPTKAYALSLFKGLFTPTDYGISVTSRFALLNLDLDAAALIARDFVVYIISNGDIEQFSSEFISAELRQLMYPASIECNSTVTLQGLYHTLVLPLLIENLFEVVLSTHVYSANIPLTVPIFAADTTAFLVWIQARREAIDLSFKYTSADAVKSVLDKAPEAALALGSIFMHTLAGYCAESKGPMRHTLATDGTLHEIQLSDSRVVSSLVVIIALCVSSAMVAADRSNLSTVATIQNLTLKTKSIIATHDLRIEAPLRLLAKIERIIGNLVQKVLITKLDRAIGISEHLNNLSYEFLAQNREGILLYIKVKHLSDSKIASYRLAAPSTAPAAITPLRREAMCSVPSDKDMLSEDEHLQKSLVNLSSSCSISPSVSVQSQDGLLGYLLKTIAVNFIQEQVPPEAHQYILFWEAVEAVLMSSAGKSSTICFTKLLPKVEEDSNNRDRLLLFYTAFYATTLADTHEYVTEIKDKLKPLIQQTAILSKPFIHSRTLCVVVEANQYLSYTVELPVIAVLGLESRGKQLLNELSDTEFASTVRLVGSCRKELSSMMLYRQTSIFTGSFPPEIGSALDLFNVYAGIDLNEYSSSASAKQGQGHVDIARLASKLKLESTGEFGIGSLLRSFASKLI